LAAGRSRFHLPLRKFQLSTVWGGGYIVGLVFMIAGPLLARYPDFAPVPFGALWAGALWTFGLYYWRRGDLAAAFGAFVGKDSLKTEYAVQTIVRDSPDFVNG
jgi:hypothetical protein